MKKYIYFNNLLTSENSHAKKKMRGQHDSEAPLADDLCQESFAIGERERPQVERRFAWLVEAAPCREEAPPGGDESQEAHLASGRSDRLQIHR